MDSITSFNEFANKAKTSSNKLRELLIDLKSKGKKVFFDADCRDEELLDSQKEVKDKYYKCDMLSEKITLLYSQMPVEHADREGILAQHAKDEEAIRGIIDAYRDGLKSEIARRNVSREKLSSSKSSCVTLKKFSGFDSEVDIYSV